MAEIRLDRLEKVYPNGRAAVRRLDLGVGDGELLVLVGPSGCGKSTTLRLVAGLEAPTAGRISIGDRDVTRLPPQERDVAMVFQSYALYPHKSVRDNLAFPLRMRRLPSGEIPERVARVARVLGIEDLLDRKPRELSGGQRQRVALGRAIVREPSAFLMDEPLSNLDARLRVRTRAELARIHRRLGATMLYVTHDQEEAMTLGDRVAVMNEGVLLQVAPPLEVYREPANVFVAGFIGSPAMNLLPAVLLPALLLQSIAPAGGHSGPGTGPMVVGIRPGDLAPVAVGEGDLIGRVEVLEPLGRELLAHVTLTGSAGEATEPLRLVTPADADLVEGREIGLRLQRDRIHLFAAESGVRIARKRS